MSIPLPFVGPLCSRGFWRVRTRTCRASLNRNLPLRGFLLRYRYGYLENAIFEFGVRLFHVCAIRERNDSREKSVLNLTAMHTTLVFFALEFALALDRQAGIGHFHFHILGFQAGKVGADHIIAVLLADFDGR